MLNLKPLWTYPLLSFTAQQKKILDLPECNLYTMFVKSLKTSNTGEEPYIGLSMHLRKTGYLFCVNPLAQWPLMTCLRCFSVFHLMHAGMHSSSLLSWIQIYYYRKQTDYKFLSLWSQRTMHEKVHLKLSKHLSFILNLELSEMFVTVFQSHLQDKYYTANWHISLSTYLNIP